MIFLGKAPERRPGIAGIKNKKKKSSRRLKVSMERWGLRFDIILFPGGELHGSGPRCQ